MGGAAIVNDKNLTPEQTEALVGQRETIKERGNSFSLPENPALKFSPTALQMAETAAKYSALPLPPYSSEGAVERSVGYYGNPSGTSAAPQATGVSLNKLYGPAPLGKTPGLADAMKEIETILKERRESGEELSPAEKMKLTNKMLMEARKQQQEAVLSQLPKSDSISGHTMLDKTPGLADAMKEIETILKEHRESGEELSPAEKMKLTNKLLMEARKQLQEAVLSQLPKSDSISGSTTLDETQNLGLAQEAFEAGKRQPVTQTRTEEGDRFHVRRAEKWSYPDTIQIDPNE